MSGVCVLGAGMMTPLGYNAPSSLAALRAGISAVRALPWPDPTGQDPLRGARVPLPQWWFGVGMQADMAAAAIGECLAAVSQQDPREIPLLIGISTPERAGRPAGLDQQLLAQVAARLQLPQHPHSRVIALDQMGCAQGLLAAAELMRHHGARHVVLCGVDSYLESATLKDFIDRRRLMTSDNSNGFFPGEAACAVLLSATPTPGQPHLRLLGSATAHEPAGIDSTEPFQALGATQSCREALRQAGATMKQVGLRLTDLSGEHYKFKEASIVASRLEREPRDTPQDLWHPIEFLGEIGAAILPALLAQALHAGHHGYAPPGLTLCHVASDAGGRAAFVLQYDGPLHEEEL